MAVWPGRLVRRDTDATELMDDPGADPHLLERTYDQFHLINTVIGRWRLTYRSWIRPLLRREAVNSILDIGCGGGDVTRALARWALLDGFACSILGIDPDERAFDHAARKPAMPGLAYRRAYSGELAAAGHRFDVIISNHMLHHLNGDELDGLLADSERMCRMRVVHADLQRSPVAYALFSTATWPVFRRSFIRADGLTSLRRSYTTAELSALAPHGWQVAHQRPYRNLLIFDGPGPGGVADRAGGDPTGQAGRAAPGG
ncbi:class I SAM-dependent methyltransferase [Arthrobacter castelli]|uniref:class I SAM-dependent methyltransferase n=1 Tax=Arthrobacter castelli TaxID=271431 RepID=UPI0004114051|nr:class I SAM-dependent methyltransferase [Arthrobacter castelli]